MKLFETKDVIFLDILKYPNLEVEENKTTFLTGESGSGKSTLFKLFNHTVSPTQGDVFYHGKNIAGLDSILLRREVLLVPQTVYLFHESIEANFERFYSYRDEPVPSADKIKKCLKLCMAPFSLDTDCTSLSGGEQQRIFLSVFLSFSPKVLLLDEPTSALDEQTARLLFDNLKSYCKEQNITLIAISHDPKLAKTYADEVIHLERGSD